MAGQPASKKRSRTDVDRAVEILWSYQISRQNAVLYDQVQKLDARLDKQNEQQQILLNTLPSSCPEHDKLVSTCQSIQHKLASFETTIESTTTLARSALQQGSKTEAALQVQQQTCRSSVSEAQSKLDRLNADVERLNDQQSSDTSDLNDKINVLQQATKALDQELQRLRSNVNKVEEHQQDKPAKRARTCSTDARSQVLPKSSSIAFPSIQARPLEQNTPPQQSECMLTVRNLETLRESSAPESFDLDQNVVADSYATYWKTAVPPSDSLEPIRPRRIDTAAALTAIAELKQGRYHSWDQYVAEAYNSIEVIPRECEKWAIQKFVQGLYAAVNREQCARWLDGMGWNWDNVTAYGLSATPSVPVHPLIPSHVREASHLTHPGPGPRDATRGSCRPVSAAPRRQSLTGQQDQKEVSHGPAMDKDNSEAFQPPKSAQAPADSVGTHSGTNQSTASRGHGASIAQPVETCASTARTEETQSQTPVTPVRIRSAQGRSEAPYVNKGLSSAWSSSDGLSLPSQQPTPARGPRKQKVYKRTRQRLPPPEIPILPTSDE
jgi:hypothetical protein